MRCRPWRYSANLLLKAFLSLLHDSSLTLVSPGRGSLYWSRPSNAERDYHALVAASPPLHDHKSSTRRSDLDPEQQIIMVRLLARSCAESTMSRWSGIPSITF